MKAIFRGKKMSEQKHIDEFEVNWDTWYVFKESKTSFAYRHYPHSVCGEDQRYQIIITLEDGKYKFDAQEYCEIYGSGDWSKWTDWKKELKDVVMKDAMERIKNGDDKDS